MTLGNATASFGLSTLATPTGTNVGNSVRIGAESSFSKFADADIAYSFKATAAAATDAFVFDLYQSSAVASVGSPTLVDSDGNDFEGVDIPSMLTIYGILYTTPSGNAGTVTFACGKPPSAVLRVGDNLLWSVPGGRIISALAATNTVTFDTIGDIVTVTVIGKSS